jgi:L-iditol 2-dehydrogenase
MKVARFYDSTDIRIEDAPVPRPGRGEALIKTAACGICSSDTLSWYTKRKAPLVIGHEPVGVIAEIGSGVNGFQVGDRVFVHHHAPCFNCGYCRKGNYSVCETWRRSKIIPGGVSEYFLVPEINLAADTLKLPESVSFEDGVLIEPTACVVKSLRKARLQKDDIILIIGLGVMGQLHALIARAAGARLVIGVDRLSPRCDLAVQLGCDFALNPMTEDVPRRVREMTEGHLADSVIIGPGSIEAMTLGLTCAAKGSNVVLFTPAQPDEQLAVEPFHLYLNEISLLPSYSCGPDDTREALRLIESGAVRADRLAIHRFPIEQTQEALKAMAQARIIKAVITFEGIES